MENVIGMLKRRQGNEKSFFDEIIAMVKEDAPEYVAVAITGCALSQDVAITGCGKVVARNQGEALHHLREDGRRERDGRREGGEALLREPHDFSWTRPAALPVRSTS